MGMAVGTLTKLRSWMGGKEPLGEGARVQAMWNGAVLADSDATVVFDGTRYFPPDSIDWDVVHPCEKETVCLWKGQAGYFTIEVDGRRKKAAAWHYPYPQPAAARIRGYIAFKRGISLRQAAPEARSR